LEALHYQNLLVCICFVVPITELSRRSRNSRRLIPTSSGHAAEVLLSAEPITELSSSESGNSRRLIPTSSGHAAEVLLSAEPITELSSSESGNSRPLIPTSSGHAAEVLLSAEPITELSSSESGNSRPLIPTSSGHAADMMEVTEVVQLAEPIAALRNDVESFLHIGELSMMECINSTNISTVFDCIVLPPSMTSCTSGSNDCGIGEETIVIGDSGIIESGSESEYIPSDFQVENSCSSGMWTFFIFSKTTSMYRSVVNVYFSV